MSLSTMLSKIRRHKSSVQDQVPSRQLTGMPALKQRRSSQRNLQLSPDFLPPRSRVAFKSVDEETTLKRDKETLSNSTPDLLKTVPDSHTVEPAVAHIAHKSIATNGHVEERNLPPSKEPKTRMQTGLIAEQASKDSRSAKVQHRKREVDVGKQKKAKKNIDSGRGLHSVKKERQANRQSLVSDSMRALTPRERETILFLEEVLKDEEDSKSDSYSENGEVFTRSSSLSSLGSIIDLVDGHKCDFENIYAEIGGEKSPRSDETAENTNNVVCYNQDIISHIDDDKSRNPTEAVNTEPVYSVVKKPKQKNINKTKTDECDINEVSDATLHDHTEMENSIPDRENNLLKGENVQPIHSIVIIPKQKNNRTINGDDKSSNNDISHRILHDRIDFEKMSPSRDILVPRTGSHSSESSSVTTVNSQRLSCSMDEQSPGDAIDESFKTRPSQFLITPSRTLPRESNKTTSEHVKLPLCNNHFQINPKAVSPSHAISRLRFDNDSAGSQRNIQKSAF